MSSPGPAPSATSGCGPAPVGQAEPPGTGGNQLQVFFNIYIRLFLCILSRMAISHENDDIVYLIVLIK